MNKERAECAARHRANLSKIMNETSIEKSADQPASTGVDAEEARSTMPELARASYDRIRDACIDPEDGDLRVTFDLRYKEPWPSEGISAVANATNTTQSGTGRVTDSIAVIYFSPRISTN